MNYNNQYEHITVKLGSLNISLIQNRDCPDLIPKV